MTTWDLHADAAKISNQSPAIKTFALHVADILQPVTPPVVVQPLWDGVIPKGQWEFAGTSKTSPVLSERVVTATTIDGIFPPPGCSTLTRIVTKPGDVYQPASTPTTGWRTNGRQPDPLDPTKIKLFGPGHDSTFVWAVRFPAGYPGDAHMWNAPCEIHQTRASYTTVTGVAPGHLIGEQAAIVVDVAGGRDGARVVYVNQAVLPGYARDVWHVFAMRYLHNLAPDGAFELWHAEAGKGTLVPLIKATGIGTMYEGTSNYFEWGIYRAQSGTSATTIFMAGGPSPGSIAVEYAHLSDALAYANGLAK